MTHPRTISAVAGVAAVMAVSMAFSAAPALATGSISCASEDGASVDLTIGSLPVMAVVSAFVQADGESWSSADEEIVAAQAFEDTESMRVDFTDPNIEEVLIRLRLFRALEGDAFAMAGTLQIVDHGAYAVTCVGP